MPVPASIADLSVTAASNSPSGADAPSVIDDHLRAHGSFIKYLSTGKQFTSEATLPSASTVDIGAASSLYVHVTGTTSISSFGADYQGPRFIRFSGALTLVHNGSSLILPGNGNIQTAAGDSCIAVPYASGWRVIHYQRAASGAHSAGPAFMAYRAETRQGVSTGVWTKVQLNAELGDTAGAFDTATNFRFQPTSPGYYSFSGGVSGVNTGGGVTVAGIYKNGGIYVTGSSTDASTANWSSVSALVYLNGSSDYVELYGFLGGSAPAIDFGAAQTFLHGFLARGA